MLEHTRLLCVPLNEQGILDLDYDNETENNRYISFPKEEYDYMIKNNLFDKINYKCDLLIDDFEEECVNKENLNTVFEIVKKHKEHIPTFINALNIAISKNTFLEIVL